MQRLVAIALVTLAVALHNTALADDFATSLCPNPPTIEGPVFISFDQSYALYTVNITTGTDGIDVVTRRDITSAEIASICSEGFDVRAMPDTTVQGSYFPVAVEFHNAALGHYFVTANAREIADLDTGVHGGWLRTGQQFQTYVQDPTPLSGKSPLAPVCRYYGLPAFGLDTHFYSAFANECDAVSVNWPDQWELETSDAFRVHLPDSNTGACPQGTAPLYRLYNNRADANHRYTTDPSIRAQMIDNGWIPEGFGPLGVGMCVRTS
jgi:hypothetical protein